MGAFFQTIFVALGIIAIIVVICMISTIGVVALVKRAWGAITSSFSEGLRDSGNKLSKMASAKDGMQTVNITMGTCQCCGHTYVGTSADDIEPLKKVEFQGETKIICDTCLDKMIKEFNKHSKSDKVDFSSNAEVLKHIFGACSKDSKSKGKDVKSEPTA